MSVTSTDTVPAGAVGATPGESSDAAAFDQVAVRYGLLLRTTDGEERRFEVAPGQSVVEATREAGTIIPSLCGKGSCGTCVGQVTSGDYSLRPFEADALGPSAGEGAVLLCCCEPTGDVEVELPYDATRLIDEAPAERTGHITGLDRLTPHIVHLTVQLDPDDLLGSAAEFEVGQYMQIEVPGTDTLRAYSMSNVGNWDGTLEFLIHIREGGAFSTYLDQKAAVGDQLRLLGPQGTFALEENGMRPRWFVGGGCGLAPLLSMLRRMAEWGDPQVSRLILGVNTPADVFGDQMLADVLAMMPELTVTLAVWKPEGDLPAGPADGPLAGEPRVTYAVGSAVDILRDDLTRIAAESGGEGTGDLTGEEAPDLYVCGPPGMVVALEEAVAAAGLPDERIHTERITQN